MLILSTVSRRSRLCKSPALLALHFMKQEEGISAHRGRSAQLEDKAHRTHSLCMLEIHSSSVQKSNMPHLYTNSGDMIVTAHMVTSLAWEIIQKSTNKHFKEEGRKGLLCCLPRVSFFKVKWPDLFETDVIRSKKNADLVNSLPLCIISDLFPFIIV